ncbi:GNAT family N-acetyltransferase [Pedococcus cremeus]|uniref:GNAT family N-acetyltransferase n=1 Tax=Pedococcus cremeus TaxID=587636 RepID=UPI000A6E5947|nr:GNAT family N-acetyltransferase [Pedococcus cremeus]
MPALVEPDVRFHASFLRAMAGFAAEGRGGGHIGYDVAPEHRRRGHATAMLRAMLPIAAEQYGIERALITCDHDNLASRKVIEACGGVFEDRRGEKLRYWVPTT